MILARKVLALVAFLLFPLVSVMAAEKGVDTKPVATTKSAVAAPAASAASAATASVAPAFSNGSASPQNGTLPQAQASPSGSFQWSYPLNLPAGTNGVQPSLSLTYNSAAPNGLLGMGFSLAGLSTIERDASRGINFASTDTYVLDGQKLYLSPSDSEASNQPTFHPERESFDRIQAYSLSGGPDSPISDPNVFDSYWIVQKKDGTRLYYGQTSDSRVIAKGRTDAQGRSLPRVWALSRVVDANENYYTVKYHQDPLTGAHYPLEIVYTKNDSFPVGAWKKISFTYQARSDHGLLYSPTPVDLTHRLKWITVLANIDSSSATEDRLVRKYELNYADITRPGAVSRLISIHEYGKDGNWPTDSGLQLPTSFVPGDTQKLVTSLSWNAITERTSLRSSLPDLSDSSRVRLGDFDGNGMTDFLQIPEPGVSAPAKIYLTKGNSLWAEVAGPQLSVRLDPFQASVDTARVKIGDFNGDAKADIYVVNGWGGSQNSSVFLAVSNGVWEHSSGPRHWVNGDQSAFIDIDRVKIGDTDGDGRSDIYVVNGANSTNSSSLFFRRADGSWYSKTGPVHTVRSGTQGTSYDLLAKVDVARVKVVDLNGDTRSDVYVVNGWGDSQSSTIFLAQANGGWLQQSGPSHWVNADPSAFIDLNRIHFGDFNGDSKTDIYVVNGYDLAPTKNATLLLSTVATATSVAWASSSGPQHTVRSGSLDTNYDILATIDTGRIKTGDFDGDGRTDVYVVNGWGIEAPATIHRFAGSLGWVSTAGPVHFVRAGSNGLEDINSVMVGNLNGDTRQDVFVGRPQAAPSPNVFLFGMETSLLTIITLPTGGTITATYTPAPQIPSVAGISGPIQPSLSVYPKVANNSPRPLVTQITLDPKLPSMVPVTTTYEYFNGQYLSGAPSERADLGFERVTQIDAAGTRTITTFSQSPPLQGMPLGTLVQAADGKMYVETVTTYTDIPVTNAHAKVRFVAAISQVTKRFDGRTTSTDTKRSMVYDSKGNLVKLTNHGILNADGSDPVSDNVIEQYDYAPSNTNYLFRMTKKRTSSYDDAPTPVQGLASETNYYYDVSSTLGSVGIGRLTKVENRVNASVTVSSTMEYDTWGNVTKTTDPSGVVTSQVTYDSTYHSLVTTTTDARSLVTTATAWDNLQPTTVQDDQGNVSRIVYDVFGRKVKTISPLARDSEASPTSETIYPTEVPAVGSPVVLITKEKTTGVTYLPTYTYLDGLGRVVQTKTLARVGATNYVTVDRYYDALGRNVAVSNPYLSSGSAFSYNASLVNNLAQRKTSFLFDALGRVTQTSRPIDASNTMAVTRTVYDQTKTISVDALNHVTEVEDRGNVRYQRTFTGTYPNHTLYTTVKVVNSRGKTVIEDDKDNNQTTPGNKIITLYDQLGRKTQYTDPDMGTWTYEYFPNGSLKKQTDAKGNVLSFTYDSAGRVSKKSQGTTVVATYQYGTTGYQRGLLEKVYLGPVAGTPYLQYTYDQHGRTTGVNKTIGTYGTKSMIMAYNADGRLASKSFPGGAETVDFVYSPEGLLRTVDGTDVYLSSTSVDDFGRTNQKSWGNGTTTSYTFDPVTFRTSDIVTPGVMNLQYSFDSVGNVSAKLDNLTSAASESYLYDELGRLKTAWGIYGNRTYLYDTTGNLLGQNGTAVNVYGGTGPHALSGDGTYTYIYDANGNVTARKLGSNTNQSFAYDAENRLTSTALGSVTSLYTYDDTRQRTTLTVGTKTTVFWFDDYEETYTSGTLTETVRSYTADGQKIAQRSSVTGLVFVYTDHLGSTSKVRNSATGVITTNYFEPFGKLVGSAINGVRETFTGQDWDSSAGLMYYNARFYDPATGRFTQGDPAVAEMQYQARLSLGERLNPYIYCSNNPVNFTDPTGMWTWGFGIVIGYNGGNWSFGFGIAADVADSTKEKTQGLNISSTVGGNGWVNTAAAGATDMHGDYQGLGVTTVINGQGVRTNASIDLRDFHASSYLYITGDEVSAGFDSDYGGISLVGLGGGWQRDSGFFVDAYVVPALGGLSYYADSNGNSQTGALWMVANWGKFGPESGGLADYTYGNRVGAKRQSGDPIDLVDAIAFEHDKGMSWKSNMRASGAARNLLQTSHRHLTPYQRVAARNLLLLRFLAPYATYVDSQTH